MIDKKSDGTQWVSEVMNGFGMTVEVKEHLLSKKTNYQQIDIFQTEKLGRMLLLDGIIQLTEFDEFAYHEMLAHIPVFAHNSAERVLVIGGGDGGVLRELIKHKELKIIDICEIDIDVVNAAKEFLPTISCGYNDPRVKLHIADGSEFIKMYKDYYDIIIVDSTDPGGPGEPLFGKEFYLGMQKSLRKNGIIVTQSESPFLLPDIVKRLNVICKGLFKYANYAAISVPTYPTGMIGCCVATNGADPSIPNREVPLELEKQLKYYTPLVHKGAFANYAFVEKLLELK